MTWSREWLRILTLRCEEASMLTSYELEERLSLANRMALRGHLLVCGSCRTLRHHLQFLRAAMRRNPRPFALSINAFPMASVVSTRRTCSSAGNST